MSDFNLNQFVLVFKFTVKIWAKLTLDFGLRFGLGLWELVDRCVCKRSPKTSCLRSPYFLSGFVFVCSAGDCCWSRVCCGWCLWRHYWGISYHWSCCSFCVWLCLTEDDTSVYNDQLCQLAYYLWCLTRSQSLNDVKKKVRWAVILLLRNPSSRHSSKSSINPPIKCVSHHWRYFDKLRI